MKIHVKVCKIGIIAPTFSHSNSSYEFKENGEYFSGENELLNLSNRLKVWETNSAVANGYYIKKLHFFLCLFFCIICLNWSSI